MGEKRFLTTGLSTQQRILIVWHTEGEDVRKNREVWHGDHAIFNFDQLYGVGEIFEVELEVNEQNRYEQKGKHYERLFRPFLGLEIH